MSNPFSPQFWAWFWILFWMLLFGVRPADGQVSGAARRVYGGASAPPAGKCASVYDVSNIWVDKRSTPGTSKFSVCVNDDGTPTWVNASSAIAAGTNGQYYSWDLTWRSLTGSNGVDVTHAGDTTIAVDGAVVPTYTTGTTVPESCTDGQLFWETDAELLWRCKTSAYVAVADLTAGVMAVAQGGTGLAGGTSGGVLAYTAAGTIASSGALTANLPVIGGGAGAAPTVGTRSGNTTEFATVTGTKTAAKQLVFDANGNVTASAYDAAASSSYDPLTATTQYAVEPFFGGGTANGAIGALGWYSSDSKSGTTVSSSVTAETGRPGQYSFSTGTTSDGLVSIHLNTGAVYADDNWVVQWKIKLSQNDADTYIKVGLACAGVYQTMAPSAGIYFVRTAAGSTWATETKTSGGTTTNDSGVSTSTSWFTLKIARYDASTIQFYINGTKTGTDHTTYVPTATGCMPWLALNNDGTTDAKVVVADEMILKGN